MTAAALVETLRARGVELVAAGDRVRYRPVDAVTAAELKALRAGKTEVLRLLRAEVVEDSWADSVPDGPCGLCGHQPLTWVEDWPSAGDARWLCLECTGRRVPSLEAVYASLSADERRRLLAEAEAGDPLARLLLTIVPVSGAA